MLWKILLFASLLPIAAGLVLRWWFGLRVLMSEGRKPVAADPDRWRSVVGETAAEGTAASMGKALRETAFRQWREQEPKAALARGRTHRFGMAVPPLAIMVAVMGILVGRLPPLAGIAAVVAATALAVAFGLLSLGTELRAIAVAARQLRASRAFRRVDDEVNVIGCAIAHAWSETVPPVLRWLQ